MINKLKFLTFVRKRVGAEQVLVDMRKFEDGADNKKDKDTKSTKAKNAKETKGKKKGKGKDKDKNKSRKKGTKSKAKPREPTKDQTADVDLAPVHILYVANKYTLYVLVTYL